MGKKDILFLMILLFVLGATFFFTLSYPYRARLFPLIVISLCGVLVLAELLKKFTTGFKSENAGHGLKGKALETEKQKQLKFFATVAWIGGFALTIYFFGFSIGLPLFVLAYVKTYEKGWRWAIILPTIMFVLVYVGFGILLESPLYEGLLFVP